jgi:hypothetical protein
VAVPQLASPDDSLSSREGHHRAALGLLGVMVVFWAVLLVAELQAVLAWRTHAVGAGPTAVTTLASAPTGSEVDGSGDVPDVPPSSLRLFGWAQLLAASGVAVSALHLRSRRSGSWLLVTGLAVASLFTSAHLFSLARGELELPAASSQ